MPTEKYVRKIRTMIFPEHDLGVCAFSSSFLGSSRFHQNGVISSSTRQRVMPAVRRYPSLANQ
jgi:hypothetical protein